MPQNSSGCLVMTCGPGTMPWMVMAPTISAITAFGGMPSVSSGMNDVCAAALLALSGRGNAFDGAAAELLRMLGYPFLERIGGEGGDHRAAAGQDADERADHRAARDRAGAESIRSLRVGIRPVIFACRISRLSARQFEIADDLGEAEDAHGDVGEADAVGEFRDVEGHAPGAGLEVGADHRHQQAGKIMAIALSTEPFASTTAKIRPSTISEKYSAGPNRSARRSAARRAPPPARSRRSRRKTSRWRQWTSAGPARPWRRHLMAVEAGDHRRGLARDVDQDRGGRAAILRAVIDAGQHDQRADRRQAEGDRQQHRDGGDRADAGQNPDQRADQRADQTKQDVDWGGIGRATSRRIGIRRPSTEVCESRSDMTLHTPAIRIAARAGTAD